MLSFITFLASLPYSACMLLLLSAIDACFRAELKCIMMLLIVEITPGICEILCFDDARRQLERKGV